jgi:hypothetical protein
MRAMPAKYFLKLGNFGELEVINYRLLESFAGTPIDFKGRPRLTVPRVDGLEVLISGDYRHLSPQLFPELIMAEVSGQHLGEATLTVKEIIGYGWSRPRQSYYFTEVYVAKLQFAGNTPPDAVVTFGFETVTLRVFD